MLKLIIVKYNNIAAKCYVGPKYHRLLNFNQTFTIFSRLSICGAAVMSYCLFPGKCTFILLGYDITFIDRLKLRNKIILAKKAKCFT